MTEKQARIMQQPTKINFIRWNRSLSKGNEIFIDFSKIEDFVDIYNGLASDEKQLVLFALFTRRDMINDESGDKALIIS